MGMLVRKPVMLVRTGDVTNPETRISKEAVTSSTNEAGADLLEA
jgi:hypothetical protein